MQISELDSTTDRQLAYGLLRLILGTNILIHGVSRLLGHWCNCLNEHRCRLVR